MGELRSLLGVALGPTEPLTVLQGDIDAFAELSGDHQWIHVDRARAERESPHGSTVAHGDLMLSVASALRSRLVSLDGFATVINRGWAAVDYVGFASPGNRITLAMEVVRINPLADIGWYEVEEQIELHTEHRVVLRANAVSWVEEAPRQG